MTGHRELDGALREWVDLGADRLPTHNLAAALAEIEITPQRRARPAPLEGFMVRFQPLAMPAAAIALLLVLAAGAYALLGGPSSVGPPPSSEPAATPAAYRTSSFAAPLTLDLPPTPDADGWVVSDSPAMVTISRVAESPDRLVILDPHEAVVVEEDGSSAPMPSHLVAWLDSQPGVDASLSTPAFTSSGQQAYTVNGWPVPVYTVVADPVDGAGRTLLDTPAGPALSVSNVATAWWFIPYANDGVWLMLIATVERDGRQGDLSSFVEMLESITIP